MDRDCTLKDYHRLYQSAYSVFNLDESKLGNKEFTAYKSKTEGNPVSLCSYKNSFKVIPYDLMMFEFYKQHKLFWMIPLEIPTGEIIGYIIRSYFDKVYRTIMFSNYSMFYGLHMFQQFKYGQPIVLTEGSRDTMYMQKYIYLYTLALNTSKIYKDHLNILLKLTNRFIILTDMDKPGRDQAKENQKLLLMNKASSYIPDYLLKDVGEYFYTSDKLKEIFQMTIANYLKKLGYSS